jgi:hypothetical protein
MMKGLIYQNELSPDPENTGKSLESFKRFRLVLATMWSRVEWNRQDCNNQTKPFSKYV